LSTDTCKSETDLPEAKQQKSLTGMCFKASAQVLLRRALYLSSSGAEIEVREGSAETTVWYT
jgi:hypothetical protein